MRSILVELGRLREISTFRFEWETEAVQNRIQISLDLAQLLCSRCVVYHHVDGHLRNMAGESIAEDAVPRVGGGREGVGGGRRAWVTIVFPETVLSVGGERDEEDEGEGKSQIASVVDALIFALGENERTLSEFEGSRCSQVFSEISSDWPLWVGQKRGGGRGGGEEEEQKRVGSAEARPPPRRGSLNPLSSFILNLRLLRRRLVEWREEARLHRRGLLHPHTFRWINIVEYTSSRRTRFEILKATLSVFARTFPTLSFRFPTPLLDEAASMDYSATRSFRRGDGLEGFLPSLYGAEALKTLSHVDCAVDGVLYRVSPCR